MREELEKELREKMFARANLDKRLKELRTIRDDISLARKKVRHSQLALFDVSKFSCIQLKMCSHNICLAMNQM